MSKRQARQAHPAKQEEKKHGDALESATKAPATRREERAKVDAVPPADHGSHAHSPAAHLGVVHSHTKPIGDMRRIEQMREPPQLVGRIGKEHRGQ